MSAENAALVDDLDPRSVTRRLLIGLIFTLPLLALSATDRLTNEPLTGMKAESERVLRLVLQAILCTVVVLYSGWPFYRLAWKSFKTSRPNIYSLIALGVGAAYIFSLAAVGYELLGVESQPSSELHAEGVPSEIKANMSVLTSDKPEPFFDSAAAIIILVLLGQLLEIRARDRTSEAIRKLTRLAPTTAVVLLADGTEESRAVQDLHPGDVVRVPAGTRAPVDGVVKEGISTFDEAMLTGEPTVVEKGPGDKVMAGTLNGLRNVIVTAARVNTETVLHQVIALVERAQKSRVPMQRTVDRIAGWYVPIVVVVSLLTFAGWAIANGGDSAALSFASICAVGVLIVACPCALGLATPLAVVAGVGRAAKYGVLFRDAAALERLAGVNAIMFDKTGTLTEGRPKLQAVEPRYGYTSDQVLGLAAAIERGSEHPLGAAIVWEAVRRGIEIVKAEGVETIPGKGIRGMVEGQLVVVGSLGFLQECGFHQDLPLSEAVAHLKAGRGVVFVAQGVKCCGMVTVEDAIRATSQSAIDKLRADGIRMVLVTGDHNNTASAVGRKLGINEVIADTLPAEKYAVVRRLKNAGLVVAVCGDGSNDAPALAAADVGIAMGTGTDIAIEAAGVTLVKPDIRAISAARDLSRATVRTIRQNLALAFACNALAIPIAAGGLVLLTGSQNWQLSPVWAAAAIAISTMLVLVNSHRLARHKV